MVTTGRRYDSWLLKETAFGEDVNVEIDSNCYFKLTKLTFITQGEIEGAEDAGWLLTCPNCKLQIAIVKQYFLLPTQQNNTNKKNKQSDNGDSTLLSLLLGYKRCLICINTQGSTTNTSIGIKQVAFEGSEDVSLLCLVALEHAGGVAVDFISGWEHWISDDYVTLPSFQFGSLVTSCVVAEPAMAAKAVIICLRRAICTRSSASFC